MLESWPALPDTPLRGAGPLSARLRERGCETFRGAAKLVRALPYGRNADRGDYHLVLREQQGTCSTKHALLAALAREQTLAVTLIVGIYDMCEANTPGVGHVLAAHGLASIPEAHCYLRYREQRVDVTRAGVVARAPIERFHAEWTIEPDEIGARKLQLHRTWLVQWAVTETAAAGGLELEDLWGAREACIRSLSER